MTQGDDRIPLTVIGGFLGAGKTTLLNRVLSDNHGIRFAVLVNDFGDLPVDTSLVTDHDGETLTFANGCLCCTMGDNLMKTLSDLAMRTEPPEHILIEASGVADPRPILDLGTLHPRLRRDLSLVLVDAETIHDRAEDVRLKETVDRQIAAADVILINKCDVVDEATVAAVRAWLRKRVPDAHIVETMQAAIPLDLVFAGDGSPEPMSRPVAANDHDHVDHGTQFRSVTVVPENPMTRLAIEQWMSVLPPSVLRVKGYIAAENDPGSVFLVQRVGNRLDLSVCPAQGKTPGVVFIGSADLPDADWIGRRCVA